MRFYHVMFYAGVVFMLLGAGSTIRHEIFLSIGFLMMGISVLFRNKALIMQKEKIEKEEKNE